MNFTECCSECLSTPDFVKEFNRLTGYKLGSRVPIEIEIDKACGYNHDEEAIKAFARFVFLYVWMPVAIQDESEAGR